MPVIRYLIAVCAAKARANTFFIRSQVGSNSHPPPTPLIHCCLKKMIFVFIHILFVQYKKLFDDLKHARVTNVKNTKIRDGVNTFSQHCIKGGRSALPEINGRCDRWLLSHCQTAKTRKILLNNAVLTPVHIKVHNCFNCVTRTFLHLCYND